MQFAPGESTQVIEVPIIGDLTEEGHEDFGVSLLVAAGDATVVASTATGTVLNDETSLSVSVCDGHRGQRELPIH